MEVTDSILGNPEVVEKFVVNACQRLGSPLTAADGFWKVNLANLPASVLSKLSDDNLKKIAFDHPVAEEAVYVGRNHPFTIALAEYLFDIALQQKGNRNIASRCGVVRSENVEFLTTLIILRLRFLVKQKELDSVAEECIVTGFEGIIGSEKWLSAEKAELLLEKTVPSGNLSDNEKRHWVATILKDFDAVRQKLDNIADNRADTLLQSYERLRKTIKSGQVSVVPLLPVDVLSLSIIVPQPKF